MGREIRSLPNAKGCFPRREQETGGPFPLGCPHLSAALDVLTQWAWPSAGGEGEGAVVGWERGAWQQVGRWRTFVSGKEIGGAGRV